MKIFWLLLLCASAFGQSITGGITITGGKTVSGVEGVITPPPPPGLTPSFFKSSWNSSVPNPWPPTDGAHSVATVTGTRIWDSGEKWAQFQGSTGCSPASWGASFSPNGVTNLINNIIPVFPMDVLYVWGSTPNGCQIPGITDSACADPSGSANTCVPPKDLDANLANCNADGHAAPGTVHADCGNGADAIFQAAVYKFMRTFPQTQFMECWNEPDGAGNFWSNSTAVGGLGTKPSGPNQPPLVRLVRMCYDMYQIAHAINPNIIIYSPSFHYPTSINAWMDFYVQTTVNNPGCSGSCSSAIGGITWPAATVSGLQTFDSWNIHGRGGSGSLGEGSGNNNPEAFLTAVWPNWSALMNKYPTGPKLYDDDENGPVNKTDCQVPTLDYLAYYASVELVSRAAKGVNSIWYYQWDAKAGGGCTNAPGTAALGGNAAGTAWDVTAGWLIGAVVSDVQITGNTYVIPLLLNGVTPAEIKWTGGDVTVNTVTSAAAASGGNQTLTCSGGCANLAGEYITTVGFSNSANLGSFLVSSSTNTSVVINNSAGASCSGGSCGTFSYRPVTCGVNCTSASADGFTHTWTDITGTSHSITGGNFPMGSKPVLLQ